MRSASLIFGFLLILLSNISLAQNAQKEEQKLLQEINALINVKRSIFLQAPLKLNDSVNAIARRHSEAMATGKVPLGHEGFLKRDSLIRIYFPNAQGTGENVTEAETAEEAVDNWWTSEGHKANLLGDYSETGIGVVENDGLWYCTQIFVQR